MDVEGLGERGEAGIAEGRAVGLLEGLTGLLRALSVHARTKRLYLPRDLCLAAGLRVDEEVFELRSSPALRRVVEQVAAAAAGHLANARARRGAVPRAALPALLPAVPARPYPARPPRAADAPVAPLRGRLAPR